MSHPDTQYAVPTTPKKRYITISQLARQLRTTTSRLRYYESQGIIRCSRPGRIHHSTRRYTIPNAQRIALVIQASDTGMYTMRALSYIYRHGTMPPLPAPS